MVAVPFEPVAPLGAVTRADRLRPAGQPGVAHHRLWQGRLPLPGRPAGVTRALPHLDPGGGRQDRDPEHQRGPTGPLPGLVRQRPETPPARHRARDPLPPSFRTERGNQQTLITRHGGFEVPYAPSCAESPAGPNTHNLELHLWYSLA